MKEAETSREKFIADVHLGKLARSLRLLGFDTSYLNNYTNHELRKIAGEEDRILLSRNPAFGKDPRLKFFMIDDEDPAKQLKQVMDHFQLKEKIHPVTRCMVCNGDLLPVPKEEIKEQLEPDTLRYFNEFWQCSQCRRIYWKGAHFDRMRDQLIKMGVDLG